MASPLSYIPIQVADDSGNPISGAKVYFYAANTVTLKNTFTTAAGDVANPNPVIANSGGFIEVWLGEGVYDIEYRTSADVLIRTVQDVPGSTGGSGGGGSLNSVESIAALKALAAGSVTYVDVAGYYANGDGGGGTFYWSASSIAADDGGITIVPNSAPGTGRWIRSYSGHINAKWFGCKGDGSTSDQTAITNANTYVQALAKGGTLFFPTSTGNYLFTANPSFGAKVKVLMDKGAMFSSTSIAMTFNGEFESAPHSQVFSSTMGAVVFAKPNVLNPVMWGAVADDNGSTGTDDSTAIQTALTCAGASPTSGGATVQLEPKAYYIATGLTIPSNVTLQGIPAVTTFRYIDAGTLAAVSFCITIGSGVSNVTVKGISFTVATYVNRPGAISVVGTRSKILDIKVTNFSNGIIMDKTAQYITVDGYLQTGPARLANYGILCNGVQDCTFNRIELTGVSAVLGIDKGLVFQNGLTTYGNQRCTVTNLTTKLMQAYGLAGTQDNFLLNVNYLECYNIFFTAATSVVAGDIGRIVMQGATTIGTLVAYDDTVIPATWTIRTRTNIPAASTVTTIAAGGSAASGTTLANNQIQCAPVCKDHQWEGISCDYGISASIGHGISVDGCFATHLTDFSCHGNGAAGVYVGDLQNFGSSIANGSCTYNSAGMSLAATSIMSIDNVSMSNSGGAGILFVAISNSLDKNVQYTKVSGCSILRNGRSNTDGAIHGNAAFCTFENNDVFENYNDGFKLTTASNNKIVNNRIIDNGWPASVATGIKVGLDAGACVNNVIENNLITNRLSPSTQTLGIFYDTGSLNNILRNNIIIAATPINDTSAGSTNLDFDNLKSTTASTIANGTGNTARTTSPSIISATVTSTAALPGLDVVGGGSPVNSDFPPIIRITNLGTNTGASPFIPSLELRNAESDYSTDMLRNATKVTLVFNAVGYTSAVDADLGKIVVGVTNRATAILKAYNNTTRTWIGEMITGAFFATETVGIASKDLTLGGTYVTPVLSDLGKVVTSSSGGVGVLIAYDPNTQVWKIAYISGTFTDLNSIAITSGTGSSSSLTSSTTTIGTGASTNLTSAAMGAINTTNGAWLGIKNLGVYVFRLFRDGVSFGVGGKKVVNHYSVTAPLDFGSIAAQTTLGLTVPLLGCLSGDDVIVTPTGAPETGLVWSGYVSASDVVTIRLANVTVAAIDPATRTWRVSTWGH